MDFAKLTGDASKRPASKEIFDFTPMNGDVPFQNGAGDPLVLSLHPAHGSEFEKVTRMMKIKEARQAAEKKGTTFVKDKTDAQREAEAEAELESEAERLDANEIEFLARLTVGWNLTDELKPVPFSLSDCKQFYAAAPRIRSLVDRRIGEAGTFLPTA